MIVADWNSHGGQETEQLVRDSGGETTFVRTDVSKVEDVQAMVAAAVSTYGGLHAIYNNAAIVKGYGGPVEAEVDDWDATMAVNVRGTYLCCKYAIPAIVASGGGSVINQSSVAAIQGGGPPLSGPCAAYTTSKSAIIGLTNSIAYSYGHQGVRANSILPGLIETGMTASLLESEEFRQAMIDSTP
ncbi:MAG: SDR family oxidoreductase, partial [Thermoleophilia bacterium]|nr:SDR family oxidoreductase [Thermoleophilia bacterium]